MRRGLVVVLAVVAVAAPVARSSDGSAQGVGRAADARTAARERVRQQVVVLLRERVGLSDDQLRKLAPVSRSFEARRQALFREERMTRQALRQELTAEPIDQTKVAGHIDALFALQRRRLDLAAEEQRELAAFMTPAQRARYLALQEHLRRRAAELRRRRPR